VTSDKPSADRLSPGQLLELYYFLKLNRGLEEKLSAVGATIERRSSG